MIRTFGNSVITKSTTEIFYNRLFIVVFCGGANNVRVDLLHLGESPFLQTQFIVSLFKERKKKTPEEMAQARFPSRFPPLFSALVSFACRWPLWVFSFPLVSAAVAVPCCRFGIGT